MRSPAFVLFLALASGALHAHAQQLSPTYGCGAPEVREAFLGPLSQDELVKLPTVERNAHVKQTLDALIAKYPHQYLLYREQWNTTSMLEGDAGKSTHEALRAQWIAGAKAHPDDPMALLLAGKAQADTNFDEAIRFYQAAQAKDPGFPWPAFELVELYRRKGKDKEVDFKTNLERFYSLCPTWVETSSFGTQIEAYKLRSDPSITPKTIAPLRAELAQQSDPKRLMDYKILWQREFLVRPPAEHDAERAQIHEDLARLEKLVPNGDGDWRLFLIEGYSLAGASNEQLDAMRAQAAKDFPNQSPAENLDWTQWHKEHPQPEGQKNTDAWRAYEAASIAQVKRSMSLYPDDAYLQRTEFYFTVQDDPFVSESDGMAAFDLYEKSTETYGGYGVLSTNPNALAKFLLDRSWAPGRALDLLEKTSTYKGGGHTEPNWSASLTADDIKRFNRYKESEDLDTVGLILQAALLTNQPQAASPLRASIEGPAPANEKDLTQYWTNRARLAALEHRPQDALAYYRLALDNRAEPPDWQHGVLEDRLMTEFHTLWTAQGGSETAWTAWNPPALGTASEATNAKTPDAKIMDTKTSETAARPPTAAKKKAAVAASEDGWKPVTDTMPAFVLSDFSGRTWKQSELAGKVVLIVSWATWCGPCNLQDEMLEKFYEKEKGRKDLVILTFNIDQNPGEVLPFMRRKGYTFPVLAAASYPNVQNFVPRTWIIDKQGHWRWTLGGYDDAKTYPEFEKNLLTQIGKAEGGA
ncbi:TlpA disulfide reductase family protein [Silvibacterium dinghuense]|uniref:TlpA family protein disulfide reductase n=1 Tax=Silvibacterium dinghuense TaxID=1560006 RepID=A0A4Q1SJ74_9BACT|nr:TlpA disulfide reductase family protein [Silvibacterium dinghuense]RXS97477.1 TlpA family protein disulfide reductase [Silvibacterium dinghuense]GGG99354.1 hypothetical protein GCM10011586_13580 [Silvibacterium dinghuense]